MANEVIPFEALTQDLAKEYQVAPAELIATVKAMCFSGAASDPQLFVFLRLAKDLSLNPFNREIYAFVKNGKMQTIVGFDGWIKMVNRQPIYKGFEFFDHIEEGKLIAVTCRMWREDWKQQSEATEYLSECVGDTEPWKKWPHRMLRNKAYIQCARMTFGFAGVVDPDEYERIEKPALWDDAPKVEMVEVKQHPVIETSASATSPTAEPPVATVQGDSPVAVAPEPQPEPEPEPAGKKLSPKATREKLDKLISRHVPAARLNLFLSKETVTSVEELTDEAVLKIIAKIEKDLK